LRTILGNAAVAIPEVDALAVETVLHAPPVVAVAQAASAAPAAATQDPADFPDLSDLDRGLYPANGTAPKSSPRREIRPDDASVAALGRGLDLDDDSSAFAPATASRQRPAARVVANEVSERRISGWTAVAVMALGLFVGGTAAMAVFRDNVSHILASWD